MRFSSLVWLLGLGACTSVLGIEDLHEGARPGSGGDAATGGDGTAGKTNVGGKTSSGGNGSNEAGVGSGGEPVSPDAGASNGGSGSGGEAPQGGDGSQGGATDPGGGAVHGRVIDFWGHALPNIPVQIGDTLSSTDENGEFVIEDVPNVYDVSMVFDHEFVAQSDVWSYQGLTRRDPTLQMYVGTEKHFADVAVSFSPKPVVASNQTIWVALAGPDGATVYDDISADGYSSTSATWYGPATATQTAHGLWWQADANGMPTSYLAYDSAAVALNETDTTNILLDLTKTTLDAGNIQGTVTSPAGGSRSNQAFLRFTSGARIQLVDDTGPNTFSYLVPSVAGSSLMIAAKQGSAFDGFAVAHVDGLAPGATPTLKIPARATPQTPIGGATGVTTKSTFTFASPNNPGPYVLQFYSQADNLAYQAIYVVTANKSLAPLSTILGGAFTLHPNSDYLWSITTHGAFASVDAMASEGGFLDPYSWDEETAVGPRSTSGEFTDSVLRRFTTAP